MKVSFKVQVWNTFEVDDEVSENVKTAIEHGKITTVDDFYNNYADNVLNEEIEMETMETMTTKQNGGFATIEIKE